MLLALLFALVFLCTGRATETTTFRVRNMLLFKCGSAPENIVIPRDPPIVNRGVVTVHANHTLRARNATVGCVGMTVLSDPNRTHTLGTIDPNDDVVPLVDPTSRSSMHDTMWIHSGSPTRFTIEVVFSLSRRVLPSSKYRLFDDGTVRVSYVVASGDMWCSTVRFIELTDDDAMFVLDFNQMATEMGFVILPDMPVHLFWVRDTETSVSRVCVNHVGVSSPSCAVVGEDPGPIGSIFEAEYSTAPAFGMFTLYLQGMFEELLTDEQMAFLDNNLPHFDHHPVPRAGISAGDRLQFRRILRISG